jgi:NADH:ubiquinone oxidoreductase subunit 2 (subunit N)
MPKILLIFLFVKFYFILFFSEFNFSLFFLLLGFFSIVVGGINAIYQMKLKRFLAYSTIVNLGFILVSFGNFSFFAMFSSLFYLFSYVFIVFLFFYFFLSYRKNKDVEFLKLFDLSLLNNNILLLFSISIFFFSFLGLPPFMGFFGKFFVYLSILQTHNYIVLLFLLIFSVIIGFYYLRVVRFLFFFSSLHLFENILNINFGNFFFALILLNSLFLFFFDSFSECICYVLLYSFL